MSNPFQELEDTREAVINCVIDCDERMQRFFETYGTDNVTDLLVAIVDQAETNPDVAADYLWGLRCLHCLVGEYAGLHAQMTVSAQAN